MPEKWDIEFSCIGFCGFKTSDNIEIIYKYIVGVFEKCNFEPTTGGFFGLDGPKASDRDVEFQKLDAKLRKLKYRAGGFSLEYTPPTGVGLKYPWIKCEFDFRNDKRNHGSFVLIIKSAQLELRSADFLNFSKGISKLLKPSYGIGYKRDLAQNPAWFFEGFVDGYDINIPEEEEEEMQIGHWGGIGMANQQVYLNGVLRDVFPWNFLTSPQLNAKVGNQTIQQWIESDPSNGKLIPMTDDMLLWEVQENQIPKAREFLKKYKRIFDYHDYVDESAGLTSEELLAHVLKMQGHDDPSTAIILDGTGKEIPTEEVREIIKTAKEKKEAKKQK